MKTQQRTVAMLFNPNDPEHITVVFKNTSENVAPDAAWLGRNLKSYRIRRDRGLLDTMKQAAWTVTATKGMKARLEISFSGFGWWLTCTKPLARPTPDRPTIAELLPPETHS